LNTQKTLSKKNATDSQIFQLNFTDSDFIFYFCAIVT